jgi:peptidoglycan/LPS O-acetylase OafA/YrhL
MKHRPLSVPAIDGLRAVAVIAVIAFHLLPNSFRGGYLGVDLFFVISGYVITALLVHQIRLTGSLELATFYRARVRRLAPAMVAVLAASLFVGSLVGLQAVSRGVQDLPFILTGTYNWRLADAGLSYFDSWSPPLFQHFWSLAIETQFYLLWPLILMVLTHRYTSGQIAARLGLVGLSLAIWNLLTSLPDSTASLSASYFATHTHLLGLLLGSALGLIWTRERLSGPPSISARWSLDVAGSLATLGLIAMFVLVSQDSAFYRHSFALSALLASVLVAVVVHPATHLSGIFRSSALTAIGRRSYSLYLWHWPVQLLFEAGGDSLAKPLTLLATVLLSEVTYRFVEQPFRKGLTGIGLPSMKFRFAPVALAASLAVGLVAASAPPWRSDLAASEVSRPSPASLPILSEPVLRVPGEAPVPTPIPEPSSITSSAFIGDSVLLGLVSRIPESLNVRVFDGVVGRQAPDVLKALKLVPSELESGAVIINLGNNGKLKQSEVDAIFGELARFKHSFVINARVPRAWQDANNDLLAREAARHEHVHLIDWHSLTEDRREYLAGDRVHLTPAGVGACIDALVSEIDRVLGT